MIGTVFGGVLALAVAMGIGRFAFTPILPAMLADTGLGVDGAGVLASVNFLGYLLGALGAGLVPHGGVRTAVFRTALVLSVASTAGMGLTTEFAVWAALRLVSGVASAFAFILAAAMVLDALAGAGREAWSGWLYTGIGLGIALSGLFVAGAGDALGWRGEWLALGAVAAGLAVVPWLAVGDPPHDPPHDPATPAAAGGGAVRWSAPLVLLTLAYFLEGGGYIITGTFLVAMLKAAPDTTAIGNAAWIVAGLAAVPSSLLWAAAGRRWGLWPALMLAHLAQAVGIVLPVLAGGPVAGPVAGLLSAALFGGTFVGIVGLAFALGRRLAVGGGAARVIGALTSAYGVGQILGPLPAGVMVEMTGRYDAALTGAAAVVLAGLGLLALGALLDGRGKTGRLRAGAATD